MTTHQKLRRSIWRRSGRMGAWTLRPQPNERAAKANRARAFHSWKGTAAIGKDVAP